jgi:hypothetical protein
VFDLIQIIYWLALSTWFGAVLFVAVAAPIIMRAMREEKPVLPTVLSVNLEGQHGTLLGGSIIGRIMEVIFRLELGCAAAIFLALIPQWVLLRPRAGALVPPILRTMLYVAAVVLMLYHWRVLWPRMWKFRQEYIDHADEPDVANPALEQLDRLQADSASLLMFLVTLLLGIIVFSANIREPIAVPIP